MMGSSLDKPHGSMGECVMLELDYYHRKHYMRLLRRWIKGVS